MINVGFLYGVYLVYFMKVKEGSLCFMFDVWLKCKRGSKYCFDTFPSHLPLRSMDKSEDKLISN